MKFSSTVHPFFNLLLLGLPVVFCAIGLWIIVALYPINSLDKLWPILVYVAVASLPILLLLDARFHTYYYVYDTHIVVKSSFHEETVLIKDITQISYPIHIRPGGMRAVLDFKGILIIYGEGYEVQITPERSDQFVNMLMTKNKTIKLFKK